ncbi:hypothetical protein Pfo_027596 [Paulownia fortunei]|nr:hypothetical protein Pfo_027596 [Paulownia fortunei]
MHDDIFRVALDQNATIVILPFHKHWEIDGSIGSENKAMQNMNIKVMDKAPCSVGILIILTGSLSILNNQSIYRVAVIYIGGLDEAESLCYGASMGQHNNVTLTIIRFLLFRNRIMKPVVISHESVHDPTLSGPDAAPAASDYNPRWEITIDRDGLIH